MRISDAPVAEVPAPEVADSLPEGVPMQDLPNGIISPGLSVETAPLPSRRLPLQVADPKRFMVFASLLAEFDLRRMRRLGGGH
jgi:hypothetical protein